ncbi:MAG: S4 domain-containing protein [Prolixibacteraceae bacterium]|jgi:ribosome-associated heat shock protein Hsp15|nr:S4 domain-containing protein [Prolixibacteraceae bacterium]
MASNSVRIDKWLWAVRVYKTRSQASEACRKGRVEIDGVSVKPSREIKRGEIIEVRKNPVTYHYKVIELSVKRMGAKLVPDFMKDVTPPENKEVLEMQRLMSWSDRKRGEGRPTKKERRDIDRLFGD